MILALAYFLVLCLLIWRSPLYTQVGLSRQLLLFLFIVKCLGCFAYYWIYYIYYPDTFMCDTKSTMHDAQVIFSALPAHPADYARMVSGFHSELETDSLYKQYFHLMDKWHRQEDGGFFLNDNRSITRLNALIMLFSFGRYPVHALFMVIFSMAGQLFLFKAFRPYFKGKEIALLLILFFTPSLFFWTSGVLKEPVTLLLMGLFLYAWFKIAIERHATRRHVVALCISVLCFMVMKPYVLVLLLLPLLIFTVVQRRGLRLIGLVYVLSTIFLLAGSVAVLKFVFHKDVVATIVKRQNDFVSLSYGGRFFLTPEKYVRFEYIDTAMLQRVDARKNIYRFRPHARYMYWNMPNLQDTIYVRDNHDTTLYPCVSVCAPAGSGIYFRRLSYSLTSILGMMPYAYVNVLCRPLFFDAHAVTELFASFENALILLFIAYALVRGKRRIDAPGFFYFLLFVVLLSFLLIGLTTTVGGAIVRYKALFLPFLLMLPLLQLKDSWLQKIPFLNRLVNRQ